MNTIVCRRCQTTKEPLPKPPAGGTLGQTIMAGICSDCWEEWQATSPLLINHYGLNLGDPSHRQQLRELMKEFLNLSDD